MTFCGFSNASRKKSNLSYISVFGWHIFLFGFDFCSMGTSSITSASMSGGAAEAWACPASGDREGREVTCGWWRKRAWHWRGSRTSIPRNALWAEPAETAGLSSNTSCKNDVQSSQMCRACYWCFAVFVSVRALKGEMGKVKEISAPIGITVTADDGKILGKWNAF